jgi:hypothetical protein
MKLRSPLLISSLVIACSVVVNLADPSKAIPKDKYFCAVSEDTLKTFVRTEMKIIKILTWVREFGGGWTPVKRCVEVSRRFQKFSNKNTLKFINAADDINGQPVLCAVAQKGDRCNKDNVLVTLPKGEDAYETARKIIDEGIFAKSKEIEVSDDNQLETYLDEQTYYDMKIIKQIAPAVTENLTPVDSY